MTKQILLVDDLLFDVVLTKRALEDCEIDHSIVVAGDGEAAYRLATERRFDLLLLDIKMPGVDGFELLQRLRSSSATQVPAIMLSGSALMSDQAQANALGAVEYVQKAVDYSEFKAQLKAALGRHGFC